MEQISTESNCPSPVKEVKIKNKQQVIEVVDLRTNIVMPTVFLVLIWNILNLVVGYVTSPQYLNDKFLIGYFTIVLPVLLVFFGVLAIIKVKIFQKVKENTKKFHIFKCCGFLMFVFGIIGGIIFHMQYFAEYRPYFDNLEELKVKEVKNCIILSEYNNSEYPWSNIEKYSFLEV